MSLKISVITPCYNMVEYIEKTIQSVVNQNYSNIEYILIDGGSTDGTIEVINKYKDKINRIISEKDKGQYDGINKGLKLATGDIISWLNADDIYFPWTLETVAKIFEKFDEVKWLIGRYSFLDESGNITTIYSKNGAKPRRYIANGWFRKNLFGYLLQESMFWRKELMVQSGFLNTDLKLAADYELWTRFAEHASLTDLTLPIAAFRKRANSRSKQFEKQYFDEVMQVARIKKKPGVFRNYFGSQSRVTNHILRLITKKKSPICYYSIKSKSWKLKTLRRSISNFHSEQLFTQ